MKKAHVFICLMVMFAFTDTQAAGMPGREAPGDQLEVYCSPDLQLLMQECIDQYREQNPGIMISLGVLDENQLSENTVGAGQVAFLTKFYLEGSDPRNTNVRVIGRDVYIPVMNPDNPLREEILKRGISASEFASLYTGEGRKDWNSILGNGSDVEVRPFRITDPSFMSYLSDFTGQPEEMFSSGVLNTCDDVLQTVKDDRQAIGFCRLSQLSTLESEGALDQLVIIPVDLNDNNRIDHFEQIYANTAELQRGIWIGKYSSHLYSRIFAVTASEAKGENITALLDWMIGDGQEILAGNGYSPLLENEKEALLAGLHDEVQVKAAKDPGEKTSRATLVVIALLLGGGVVLFVVLAVFNDRKGTQLEQVDRPSEFVDQSIDVPGGYYFDRSHTWTFLERDGNIRVGLDNFVQRITGKITRIEMKKQGEWIRKGQPLFSIIQNGKRLDIKSPVTGTISERNSDLNKDAGLINTSPFSDGWVYMIEPSDWAEEFATFLKGTKYREWIKSEFLKLKDFLVSIPGSSGDKVIVMQEGGEPREGVLGEMGPDVWEDFQSDFLKY